MTTRTGNQLNEVALRIREMREISDLTQEEMAHRMGISLTAYRDLEKGATGIVNSNISKIAEITGISTAEVLGYSEQSQTVTVNDVKAEYNSRIDTMQTRINDLEKIVASLEALIKVKDEVISMLKKHIDENR